MDRTRGAETTMAVPSRTPLRPGDPPPLRGTGAVRRQGSRRILGPLAAALLLAAAAGGAAAQDEDEILRLLDGSPATRALGIRSLVKDGAGYAATLDAIHRTVHVFLSPDGKAVDAALVLGDWQVEGLAAFETPVLIVATADNSVPSGDLPPAVLAAVQGSLSGGALPLKQGVNLVTGLDLRSPSVLTSLLVDALGAGPAVLPLTGTLGADALKAVLGGSTPSGGNLDGASLSFTIPALRPPLLGGLLTAGAVPLHLSHGGGGFSMDGSFDLALALGGTTFPVKGVAIRSFAPGAAAGSPCLSLGTDLSEAPGLLSRIPGLSGISVKGFEFDVVRGRDGSLAPGVRIPGSGSLKGARGPLPVDFTLALEPQGGACATLVRIDTRLTVADLVGHEVPVLGTLALDRLEFEVSAGDLLAAAAFAFDGSTATLAGLKIGETPAFEVGLDRVSLSTFAPSLKGTAFDALVLEKPAVFLVPGEKGGGGATLRAADMPETLKEQTAAYRQAAGDAIALRPGITFVGSVSFQPEGTVGRALSVVGLASRPLPLLLNLPPGLPESGGGAAPAPAPSGGPGGTTGGTTGGSPGGATRTRTLPSDAKTTGLDLQVPLDLSDLTLPLPSFLEPGGAAAAQHPPRIVARETDAGFLTALELPAGFSPSSPPVGGSPGTPPPARPVVLGFDVTALGRGELSFGGRDAGSGTWESPFGIPHLALGGLSFDIALGKDDTHFDLQGLWTPPGPSAKKDERVVADISFAGKEIRDVSLSLPDTTVHLLDLPGLDLLPPGSGDELRTALDTVSLKAPCFSLHAVSGTLEFKGMEDLTGVAFQDPATGAWNFVVLISGGRSIADLFGMRPTDIGYALAAEIAPPDLSVVLSGRGYQGTVGSLPLPARIAFQKWDPGHVLSLMPGLSLCLTLDPASPHFSKSTAENLKRMGLTQPVGISGGLAGLFGGVFALELSVDLQIESPFDALPVPGLKTVQGAGLALTLEASTSYVALGVRGSILLQENASTPGRQFRADLQVLAEETGIDFRLKLSMVGSWDDAFGLKGFTVRNPSMAVGVVVGEGAQLEFALSGEVEFPVSETSGVDIGLAGAVRILPEAYFMPDAFAAAGKLPYVDPSRPGLHSPLPLGALPLLAQKLVAASSGKTLAAGDSTNLQAEIRDFYFAFMTPNAGPNLPQEYMQMFSLSETGVGLKGELWLVDPSTKKGQRIGSFTGWASDLGFHIEGTSAAFSVGPVSVGDGEFLFEAGLTEPPALRIKAQGTIVDEKTFSGLLHVTILPARFLVEFDTTVNGTSVHASAKSGGLSLDPSNDFTVSCGMDTDFMAEFRRALAGSLQGMEAAKSLIDDAEKLVDTLEGRVGVAKADYEKARSAGPSFFGNTLDDLVDHSPVSGAFKSQVKDDVKKILGSHHAHTGMAPTDLSDKAWDAAGDAIAKTRKKLEKERDGIGPLEIAKRTALGLEIDGCDIAGDLVDAMKKTAAHILGLDKALDDLQKELADGKSALQSLEDMNAIIEDAGKSLLQGSGDLEISGIQIDGSLRGLFPGLGGTPPTFTMAGQWNGKGGPLPIKIVLAGGANDTSGLVGTLSAGFAGELLHALSPR